MRILLFLLISITCQAQVAGTFKSVRIINSDSTHGEVDGTEYRTSTGFYRYKENGVWYYRASTADIAAAATTAENGLTKVGSATRLGGTLTSNTLVTDDGNDQNLEFGENLNRLGNFRVYTSGQVNLDASTSTNVQTGTQSLGLSTTTATLTGATIALNSTTALNANSTSGAINLRTNSVSRLQIDNDGSWTINSTPGSSGQALVSNGASGTPTWQSIGTIGGTIASTQVGYGSGANTLTSEADFTYTAASNTLSVDNIAAGPSTGLILTSASGGNVTINSPSGGTGISLNATSGNIGIGGNGDITMSTTNNITVSANSGSLLLQGGGDDIIMSAADDILLTTNPVDNNALTSLLGRNSSTGAIEERTVASITGAPAGSDTQVQFNNAGALGADADFIYASATNTLTVGSTGSNNVTIDDLGGFSATVTGGSQTSAMQYFGITSSGTGGFTISNSGSGNVSLRGDANTDVTLDIQSATAGDVTISPAGGASGSYLIISNLPTSSAGLPSGAVWSNAGILTIVP